MMNLFQTQSALQRGILYLMDIILLGSIGLFALPIVAPVAANGGPHGDYIATTDACAGCHRTHTGANARMLPNPVNDNALCFACHNGTGAAPTVVSTHGNTDFSPQAEGQFTLNCTQCHDPHGSYANLSSIKSDVLVLDGTTTQSTGPILFTALTGTNSFDDGVSPTNSRLCVACHDSAANPGYPMTNHTGGASHSGGNDFVGQNCTACHLHSADSDFNTIDGFMPSRGCTICHAAPQGNRREIVSEFGQTSHHVQGQVTDTDCLVCHDTSSHQAGTVYLNNVDVPGTSYAYNPADPTTAEPACLACHDADGANGAAPFSDGIMPPAIDANVWNTTTHAQPSANGAGTCFDCHTNGHGSVQTNILLDTYVMADYTNWDTTNYQLCWKCHDPARVVGRGRTTNAFSNLHWRHVGREQAPCVACHNPHTPHDAGEPGLVDFSYALANGFDMQLIGGYDAGSAFWVNGSTGYCYIACHGENHTPENYRRNSTNTLWGIIQGDFDYIYQTFLPLVYKNASGR